MEVPPELDLSDFVQEPERLSFLIHFRTQSMRYKS